MLTICEPFGVKKPRLAVLNYKHHPKFKFCLDLRAFGNGRKFFKTRAEADAERLRQLTLLERHGREAIGLPQRELSDFIAAKRKLAEYKKTIGEAVEYFVDHLERVRRCKVTVAELANEVVETKRKDGRSAKYIADLDQKLRRFCREFGDRPIAAVGVSEIDKWLRDLDCLPKSRVQYRANIGVLFSHAERLEMIDRNPVPRTAKPKLVDAPAEIFTVDELRALLEAAQRAEPSVLPVLAIGAFAGLRDAEIKRLDWTEVDLARGHIEVKAAKAKSARRRIIPILPNLAAWLGPYSGLAGQVVPRGARRKLDCVRKTAALARWPNNGLRHSFASYRLAAIHDAPRVASELGHTSPQMLYSTYREVVRPEEAERYWKIMPVAQTANVVSFNTASSQILAG
jgi:integrase